MRITRSVRGLVPVLGVLMSLVAAVRPAVAGEMRGVFITHCGLARIRQVDPIMSPGMATSDHLHQFFANRSVDENSTYRSMRNGATTCTFRADTSGYWTPMLVSPSGRRARPQSISAYYRAVGALADRHVRAFPRNLRMISHRYFFSCGETGHGTARPKDCGSRYVHASVVFPACWDGRHLDSANHRSHMAFQTGRGCPRGHPVAVPRLVVIVRFAHLHDGSGFRLTSGSATTMHGDFWNTWRQHGLVRLVTRCIDRNRPCGDLGL